MKKEIDKYLKDNLDKACKIASEILDKDINQQSLNGIIGGKNSIYDVNPLTYDSSEAYCKAWKQAQQNVYEKEKDFPYDKSSKRVHKLLENDFMNGYIDNYLTRTYDNKHK